MKPLRQGSHDFQCSSLYAGKDFPLALMSFSKCLDLMIEVEDHGSMNPTPEPFFARTGSWGLFCPILFLVTQGLGLSRMMWITSVWEPGVKYLLASKS